MLPSEIASIAGAVSGLAATVLLIYVGIQIRQSVRHTMAQIHQGTAARTTTILLGRMNADTVAAWIEGNGGTPTPELIRSRQFQDQCGLVMIAMEDYFSQHELGLLSEEQFSWGRRDFPQYTQGARTAGLLAATKRNHGQSSAQVLRIHRQPLY